MKKQVRLFKWGLTLSVLALQLRSVAQPLLNVGSTYSQDFSSLSNSGLSSSTPIGWEYSETGPYGNNLYQASDGVIHKADTYSWGSTSSTDRAFGTIYGMNVQSKIGIRAINNTGSVLDDITVNYTGEEWFLGVSGNGVDTLHFQYSTDATSLSTGTWTSVTALDFTSPNDVSIAGPIDGNAVGNRTSFSTILTGLNVADGAIFWLRWRDTNAPGKDDGLGVDDFSIDVPSTVYYQDNDGDTYGNALVSVVTYTQPSGYVADNTDCDDTNPSINPGAAEVCNGIDDDCDGFIDDADPNVTGQPTWYADTDGDSFGDAGNSVLACSQPVGYVSDNSDCDDTNPNIYPGAVELCNNKDDDCNGIVDDGVVCVSPLGISVSNITSSTALISWQTSGCAYGYRVRHRPIGDPTWIYVGSTDTFRVIVNMFAGTDYEVQVQTFCDALLSDSSGYSASSLFTTSSNCYAPSGLFADNFTSSSATLHWTEPANGDHYLIKYKLSSDTSWATAVGNLPAGNSSYNLTGLSATTGYDWKIRTKCGGDGSNFSEDSFTTLRLGNFNSGSYINVHPNPNTGQFIVELNCLQDISAEIMITDVLGRTVQDGQVQLTKGLQQIPMDMSEQPNGNYFVMVATSEGTQLVRVEISR